MRPPLPTSLRLPREAAEGSAGGPAERLPSPATLLLLLLPSSTAPAEQPHGLSPKRAGRRMLQRGAARPARAPPRPRPSAGHRGGAERGAALTCPARSASCTATSTHSFQGSPPPPAAALPSSSSSSHGFIAAEHGRGARGARLLAEERPRRRVAARRAHHRRPAGAPRPPLSLRAAAPPRRGERGGGGRRGAAAAAHQGGKAGCSAAPGGGAPALGEPRGGGGRRRRAGERRGVTRSGAEPRRGGQDAAGRPPGRPDMAPSGPLGLALGRCGLPRGDEPPFAAAPGSCGRGRAARGLPWRRESAGRGHPGAALGRRGRASGPSALLFEKDFKYLRCVKFVLSFSTCSAVGGFVFSDFSGLEQVLWR